MMSGAGPERAPERARPDDVMHGQDGPDAAARTRLLREAIFGMALRTPHWSAARRIMPGQQRVLAAGGVLLLLILVLAPGPTLWLGAAAATVGFFSLIVFRLWAAVTARALPEHAPVPEEDLPLYTVIAPLYREARVAGSLVAALQALDYPSDRLDVLLVAEEDDEATLEALRRHAPSWMRILAVPRGSPRTKPKALTYALAFARGSLVTIYDAEDRPHPLQLRAAAAAFRAGGPDLVCVQAPLTYYNARENFLTRCFQLEYAVHFRLVLPALIRLGAPVPLGGTSNHFRADRLRAAGGWDPFNVTEDADLGFRLAHHGGRMGMIAPPTWEEATCRLWPWVRQRSRWLKGYAQTILVHTRRVPGGLGPSRGVSLWLTLGGALGAALLHAPALAWLAFACSRTMLFGGPAPSGFALTMLGAGYASAGVAGCAAAWMTRDRSLLFAILLTPFYWPLQSVAAVLALRQLIVAPFRWEKTEHGVSRLPRQDPAATEDAANADERRQEDGVVAIFPSPERRKGGA